MEQYNSVDINLFSSFAVYDVLKILFICPNQSIHMYKYDIQCNISSIIMFSIMIEFIKQSTINKYINNSNNNNSNNNNNNGGSNGMIYESIVTCLVFLNDTAYKC
jgi:hypothetical protein